MRGIHRSPVNSTHKGQWRGALMFSLIFAWINGWVNNREAGDLRRHRAHYDVTVMFVLVRVSLGSSADTLLSLHRLPIDHVLLKYIRWSGVSQSRRWKLFKELAVSLNSNMLMGCLADIYKKTSILNTVIHYKMMTSPNGKVFRVIGPLCGEFTGHRWITLTQASDAELWCFLWSAPE